MRSPRIFEILLSVLDKLAGENPAFVPQPVLRNSECALLDCHIQKETIALLDQELKHRFGGITINIAMMFAMQEMYRGTPMDMGHYKTLGQMADHIFSCIHHGLNNPLVVYVDDEEDNLFLFKRKYGKRLNLKTFQNPQEAAQFILQNSEVVLVITDEVMPQMSGNELCDLIHKSKPFLKFVLITGNPAGDDNLMHKTLRQGRFYEFLNKPLDMEKRGEEYFEIFQRVILSEYY